MVFKHGTQTQLTRQRRILVKYLMGLEVTLTQRRRHATKRNQPQDAPVPASTGKRKIWTQHQLGSRYLLPGVDYLKYTFHGLSMPSNSFFGRICTLCCRQRYNETQLTPRLRRTRQVPRVTETESLVDIRVRSQRNPHKTLLCNSTPRVLVQPGYPTRGGEGGGSVCSRRSVSGDFRGTFCGFLGALGFFLGGAFVGAFAAPSAPSPVWVLVGRSLWSACRAVPLLCVLLAALARALLPSFFVALGPSSFLVCVLFSCGSLVDAFFGCFPGMLGAR